MVTRIITYTSQPGTTYDTIRSLRHMLNYNWVDGYDSISKPNVNPYIIQYTYAYDNNPNHFYNFILRYPVSTEYIMGLNYYPFPISKNNETFSSVNGFYEGIPFTHQQQYVYTYNPKGYPETRVLDSGKTTYYYTAL